MEILERIAIKEFGLKPKYKPSGKHSLLSHEVLGPARRQFFIDLQAVGKRMLSFYARRLPDIDKENTNFEGTHVLMDIFDKMEQYTGIRKDILRDIEKLLLYKIEVDIFYKDWFIIFIEEVIKKILAGEFPSRYDGVPLVFWSNTTPHGGARSIISILQNKKALENLMGDDWKLKEKNLWHE